MTTTLLSVLAPVLMTVSLCMADDAPAGPSPLQEAIAASGELAALADRDPPPWQRIADESRRTAGMVDALARAEGERARNAHPEAAERIAKRSASRAARPLGKVPAVLYRQATIADLRIAWRRQLQDVLHAVHGLLTADPDAVKEWMMAWVEAKPGIDAFFRLEHARDYLAEAEKLAMLLAGEADALRIDRGRVLFADGFAGQSARWQRYGPGTLAIGDGRMRIRGSGTSVVCDQTFADAIIAFDFTPVATGPASAGGPGSLVAFPATPLGARGFAASAGPMADYNDGIDTYHVSLFRGATGCSNLRRTGMGLRMLSHVEPDPCSQLGRTYHVELVKVGPSVQVFVDDRLIHAYVDAGVFGDVRERGCFGIRTFSGGELELALAGFSIAEPAARTP